MSNGHIVNFLFQKVEDVMKFPKMDCLYYSGDSVLRKLTGILNLFCSANSALRPTRDSVCFILVFWNELTM